MKIPLPNLDDRRWSDLVDEGRSIVPLYAPCWTDHNLHDPGITIIELLAWITEMDIYQLNRIPDRHKWKFLSLIGIRPEPPRPARIVIGLTLKNGSTSFQLPASTEFAGIDAYGKQTAFVTEEAVSVAPGKLAAIQLKNKDGFHNVTDNWKKLQSLPAFGAIPSVGSELYFGFTRPLEQEIHGSIFFKFAGERSSERERQRILEEASARKEACAPPAFEICCPENHTYADSENKHIQKIHLKHHGVRTEWEAFLLNNGKKEWIRLAESKDEVVDDTRAFTLDGRVSIKPPAPMIAKSIGLVSQELYYLRCRFDAGSYDAVPAIDQVIFNGVQAQQSFPASPEMQIAPGATITGNPPNAGDWTTLRVALNDKKEISNLHFDGNENDSPPFRLLAFNPPTPQTKGNLVLDGVFFEICDGRPNQQVALPLTPALRSTLEIFTLEEQEWHRWTLSTDFDASSRSDFHCLLDATTGVFTFGSGEAGRVPPAGSVVAAIYQVTRAEAGNLQAQTALELLDSLHNRFTIPHFDLHKARIDTVVHAASIQTGMAAETLDEATIRAIHLVNETTRAVTLEDYEELAQKTPGVHLARASARGNLHPDFPCFKAPGIITLIVVPNLPVAQPLPSFGMKRAIASYLHRKRIIGTRLIVVGPEYVAVSIHVTVKAAMGVLSSSLHQSILDALNRFLHPLYGGPEKTGWPFGRDVYRSEIMQVIDETPGVSHVISLELVVNSCEPQCGNVCLGPTSLVAAGKHVIQIL